MAIFTFMCVFIKSDRNRQAESDRERKGEKRKEMRQKERNYTIV
jgi:hypothetical protein